MSMVTSTDLDTLRARIAAGIGGRIAADVERLGWSAEQTGELQRSRLAAAAP